MKTVVIVHHTGAWGGGTKSLIDLCEMLCDYYKVIVCIPKGFPDFRSKFAQYGCSVHEMADVIPFINIYSGRPPFVSVTTLRSVKSLLNIKKCGDEILSLHPDVVIFNTLVTAVTARYLSNFTKVICINRETQTSKLNVFIYKCLLDHHLKAMTFLSECEMNKFAYKSIDALVFPDCVDLRRIIHKDRATSRENENIAPEKYVVLYMGGLAKLKGTDVILEAFASLDERFLLVFAGEMDKSKLSKKQLLHDLKYPSLYRFKKKVLKYYNNLNGTSKYHEAGLVNSIDELIIASDLIVFPATAVHQPRPCIEAGAYGKPVIISDYKETKEYFLDGYNAIAFKPGSAKELAEGIMYAYEHPKEMKAYGEHNYAMTEQKHNFLECRRIINELIEKVASDAH